MARSQRPVPGKKNSRLYDQDAGTSSSTRKKPYDQAAERPSGQKANAVLPSSPQGFSAASRPPSQRLTRPSQAAPSQARSSRPLSPEAAAKGGVAVRDRPAEAHRRDRPSGGRQAESSANRRSGPENRPVSRQARASALTEPLYAPLEEEEAPLPTLRNRGQASRRRARRRRALAGMVLLLLTVGIWFSVMFVFKISTITISGGSVYNESVILEHFSPAVGDNLFTFNKQKTEQELLTALPYLETVKVSRLLPGSVHIEITPSEECYAFENEEKYVVTTAACKVLRIGENTGNLLDIQGAQFAQTPTPGQPLELAEETQKSALTQLLAALEADGLKNLSHLQIGDVYDISVQCENRFIVRLGTTVQLDYKLRLAAETIYNQLEADATGIVDVSSAATSRSAYYTARSIN